jgi:hypothetical protein
MAQNPWPLGCILIVAGGAILAYGLGLGYWRRWRMRRFQRESGAAMAEVEAWFRPSHGWLSDLFRRGAALGTGYPLFVLGGLLIAGSVVPPGSRLPDELWMIEYSLAFSVLLAFVSGGLLHLFCTERIAGGYILYALPRAGYDYAKAERRMRGWLRAGPVFSVTGRFLGLILLGIAWFIGSAIADNLAPHLHAWLGR